MAIYLRFDDRRYAGGSKYRPSEGWIDVRSYSWGDPVDPRPTDGPGASRSQPDDDDGADGSSIQVTIADDRVLPLLFQAFSTGQQVGDAVVEIPYESAPPRPLLGPAEVRWKRLFLSDVTITAYASRRFGNVSLADLELSYQTAAVTPG
ncbi:MAG TPA: type VI secretion system tube protein Hcp [Gemmataceae bacterium]|jgi:hypothetical protein